MMSMMLCRRVVWCCVGVDRLVLVVLLLVLLLVVIVALALLVMCMVMACVDGP